MSTQGESPPGPARGEGGEGGAGGAGGGECPLLLCLSEDEGSRHNSPHHGRRQGWGLSLSSQAFCLNWNKI